MILEDIIKSGYITSAQISEKFSFQPRIANQYLHRLEKLGIVKQVKFYRNYLSYYRHAPEPTIAQIMRHISPLAQIGYQELLKRRIITQEALDEKIKEKPKYFFASVYIYGLILVSNIKVFLPQDIEALINENQEKYSILVKMSATTVRAKLSLLTPLSAVKIIVGPKTKEKGWSSYKFYYYVSGDISFLEALAIVRPTEVKSLEHLVEKDVLVKEDITEDYLKQNLGKNWHLPLIVLNSIIELSNKINRYITFNDLCNQINLNRKSIQRGLKVLYDLGLIKIMSSGTFVYGRVRLIN